MTMMESTTPATPSASTSRTRQRPSLLVDYSKQRAPTTSTTNSQSRRHSMTYQPSTPIGQQQPRSITPSSAHARYQSYSYTTTTTNTPPIRQPLHNNGSDHSHCSSLSSRSSSYHHPHQQQHQRKPNETLLTALTAAENLLNHPLTPRPWEETDEVLDSVMKQEPTPVATVEEETSSTNDGSDQPVQEEQEETTEEPTTSKTKVMMSDLSTASRFLELEARLSIFDATKEGKLLLEDCGMGDDSESDSSDSDDSSSTSSDSDSDDSSTSSSSSEEEEEEDSSCHGHESTTSALTFASPYSKRTTRTPGFDSPSIQFSLRRSRQMQQQPQGEGRTKSKFPTSSSSSSSTAQRLEQSLLEKFCNESLRADDDASVSTHGSSSILTTSCRPVDKKYRDPIVARSNSSRSLVGNSSFSSLLTSPAKSSFPPATISMSTNKQEKQTLSNHLSNTNRREGGPPSRTNSDRTLQRKNLSSLKLIIAADDEPTATPTEAKTTELQPAWSDHSTNRGPMMPKRSSSDRSLGQHLAINNSASSSCSNNNKKVDASCNDTVTTAPCTDTDSSMSVANTRSRTMVDNSRRQNRRRSRSRSCTRRLQETTNATTDEDDSIMVDNSRRRSRRRSRSRSCTRRLAETNHITDDDSIASPNSDATRRQNRRRSRSRTRLPDVRKSDDSIATSGPNPDDTTCGENRRRSRSRTRLPESKSDDKITTSPNPTSTRRESSRLPDTQDASIANPNPTSNSRKENRRRSRSRTGLGVNHNATIGSPNPSTTSSRQNRRRSRSRTRLLDGMGDPNRGVGRSSSMNSLNNLLGLAAMNPTSGSIREEKRRQLAKSLAQAKEAASSSCSLRAAGAITTARSSRHRGESGTTNRNSNWDDMDVSMKNEMRRRNSSSTSILKLATAAANHSNNTSSNFSPAGGANNNNRRRRRPSMSTRRSSSIRSLTSESGHGSVTKLPTLSRY